MRRWWLIAWVVAACSAEDALDPAGHRRDALVVDTWTQRTVPGPAARWSPVMVYDRLHKYTLLFGGSDGTTVFNDTWRYDGTSWARLTPPSAPPGRSGAAAAWDETRQVVVLFGGLGTPGISFRDVWEWTGSTWIDRTPVTGGRRHGRRHCRCRPHRE